MAYEEVAETTYRGVRSSYRLRVSAGEFCVTALDACRTKEERSACKEHLQSQFAEWVDSWVIEAG